jgi:tetratricopeptide (TPR) repeat protein
MTDAMDNEQLTTEVAKELREGQVVFLVGAGISTERQSWIPLWGELVSSLLRVIAGEEGRDEVQYTKPLMSLLFNEVIFNQMTQIIGLNKTAEALKACMNTNSYSAIHKFLAWAMKEFKNPVLTTNYDELIEEAVGWRQNDTSESNNLLIKLHGTLSKVEKARFTINLIFAPLEDNLKERAVNALNDRIVVVAGYQGLDEFDVIPILFDEAHPRTIVWLVHSKIDPTIKKKLEEGHYKCFKVDVDEFLRKVYEKAKQGKSQLELDNWQGQCLGNQKEWWKAKLERWGDNLWQSSKNEVRFLWARILDYLRIYRVYQDETERRPAEEAYKRFLNESSDRVLNLEVKMRLAYVRRTVGMSSLEESYEVVDEIKSSLEETQGKNERKRLQMHLSRALHEYGIVLQNARDHIKARLVLDEAMKLRTLINDLQFPYSLFQEFINAVQATRTLGYSVDSLAPIGWRSWLISELEKYSNQFKEASQPEDYGQTLHNLAFVHQFLAEEFEKLRNFDEAEKEFNHSLKAYDEAMEIRKQLRDRRMIAQSKVRIAQCNLGLARISCERGDNEEARERIDKAEKLGSDVEGIYNSTPQERFRWADVKQIREEATRLKKLLNSMEKEH